MFVVMRFTTKQLIVSIFFFLSSERQPHLFKYDSNLFHATIPNLSLFKPNTFKRYEASLIFCFCFWTWSTISFIFLLVPLSVSHGFLFERLLEKYSKLYSWLFNQIPLLLCLYSVYLSHCFIVFLWCSFFLSLFQSFFSYFLRCEAANCEVEEILPSLKYANLTTFNCSIHDMNLILILKKELYYYRTSKRNVCTSSSGCWWKATAVT